MTNLTTTMLMTYQLQFRLPGSHWLPVRPGCFPHILQEQLQSRRA
jgi:hypothetical protein